MPGDFKPLNSAIEDIYRQLGLLEEFLLGSIRNKWPQIVGEGLSFHSEPLSLKDGELIIKVRSHLWAEEMRFQSQSILERLKPYKVKTLKFRIGKITEPRGKSQAATSATAEGREGDNKISKEISEFAESAVAYINDERLKDSIKRAMEKSLSRRQKQVNRV